MSQNTTFRILFIIICAVLFVFALGLVIAFVVNSSSSKEVDDGYKITTYSTEVSVLNDNTAYVTERISARFYESGRHGIVRALPKQTTHDGLTFSLDYTEIEVNGAKFEQYEQNGNICLKMGDASKTLNVDEPYAYTINYRLHFGVNRALNYDFFYIDFIKNWNTTVSNASITVDFNRDIDNFYKNSVVYYSSQAGLIKIKPILSGNIINFEFDGTINPFEALSLNAYFNDDFFADKINNTFDIVALVVCLIILVALILIFALCRSRHKVEKVQANSVPKGINSAEAGCIIDTFVDNRDVASLIVYWASNGNINIIERSEFGLIFLEKVKELANAKDYENDLFAKIFADKDKVEIHSLNSMIGECVKSCKRKIAKQNDRTNFEGKALKAMWWLALLPIIGLFVASISAMRFSGLTIEFLVSFLLIFFATGVTCALINIRRKCFYYGRKKFLIFSIIALILITGVLVSVLCLGYEIMNLSFFAQVFASVNLLIACSLILLNQFYSERGAILVSRLIGFKKYIETEEKGALEAKVNENPQLFFQVLPYAYVLGVSEIWCKKFENAIVSQQNGYVSDIVANSSDLLAESVGNSIHTIGNIFMSHKGGFGVTGIDLDGIDLDFSW
ncbi:MAG: DUF2207 domain-containing protein [Clostridia bacterium]|nr:DUF2207 domain-containing protein [Clostridia bacterium]